MHGARESLAPLLPFSLRLRCAGPLTFFPLLVSHPDKLWLLLAPAGQEPCPVPVLGPPCRRHSLGRARASCAPAPPHLRGRSMGGPCAPAPGPPCVGPLFFCDSDWTQAPRRSPGSQGRSPGRLWGHLRVCPVLRRAHSRSCLGEKPRAGLELEFLFPALVTPECPVAHPLPSPTVASAHLSARRPVAVRWAGIGGVRRRGPALGGRPLFIR